MGYDIYIGSPVEYIEWVDSHIAPDGTEVKNYALYDGIVKEYHPAAPAFEGDGLSAHRNGRHPSYGGWAEFAQVSGLDDLFFDEENGMMVEHPGIVYILPDDYAQVRDALARWKQAHPGASPGFMDGEDPILARLIWLDWWMYYALGKYGKRASFLNF